jgi:hypothetical protein
MNEAQAQNLEGRIAKAEEILKGVRDEISKAKEQPVKRWEPKHREKYVFLSGSGHIEDGSNTDHYFDKNIWSYGNCFPPDSKSKLSDHVRRIKLMNELFQVALAIDGEKAGVFEEDKANYLSGYQGTGKGIGYCLQVTNLGSVYFSTEAKALQAWDMISQESRDFLMGK